jgi:hypothetical protein
MYIDRVESAMKLPLAVPSEKRSLFATESVSSIKQQTLPLMEFTRLTADWKE